jgi:glutathione synthase/RimK-type ligase-like ATP-grasp enzyme
MTTKLYAYKQGSASAKALAAGLDIKVLKVEGSKWRPKAADVIINWGSSATPAAYNGLKVYNPGEKVANATNKLTFFNTVEGDVVIPSFTTDKNVVAGWLADGATVVARQKLTGHSGEGIVIIEAGDRIVDAPLYVKYVPKKDEYRIHVLGGKVVDIQRKARNKEVEDGKINWKVRNHHNGFVFVRNDVNPPAMVTEQAVKAIEVTGLDFGAVDVIWNDKHQMAYVLEVNTAPGLTGTTLEGYVARFKELLQL